MVDHIESAVSLSTFNFLFPDAGETLENAAPVEIPLPEFPNINIDNDFLGLCDSSNPTRNRRQDLHVNPLPQPKSRPFDLEYGSYYEMQHLKAQYQNLEKYVECLNQNLQCVQDE